MRNNMLFQFNDVVLSCIDLKNTEILVDRKINSAI